MLGTTEQPLRLVQGCGGERTCCCFQGGGLLLGLGRWPRNSRKGQLSVPPPTSGVSLEGGTPPHSVSSLLTPRSSLQAGLAVFSLAASKPRSARRPD